MRINEASSGYRNGSTWIRCAYVFVIVAVATIIRLPIQPLIHDASPFLLYFPVVVAVAIAFGPGFGLLATAVSLLPANYFWMAPERAFALDFAEACQILGFSFAGCSVSWLTEAVRKRKQLTDHFRGTLASLGDAVVTTDCRGKIVYLNAMAQVLTELHSPEAIGSMVGASLNLVTEDNRSSLNGAVQMAITGDDIEAVPERLILLSKTGRQYRVEQRMSRILDAAGRNLGVAILFRRAAELHAAQAPGLLPAKNEPIIRAPLEPARAAGASVRVPVEAPVSCDTEDANDRAVCSDTPNIGITPGASPKGLTFLICGAGRSGTSLLLGMLDNHDTLEIGFEKHSLCLMDSESGHDGHDLIHDRVKSFLVKCEMEAARHPGKIWGNKITTEQLAGLEDHNNITRGGKVDTLDVFFNGYLHGVKVVFIMRDGRASVRSKIKRANLSVEQACDRWNYCVRVYKFLQNHHCNHIMVRYEDLLLAPENTLRRICAFLEIDFQPAMLEGVANLKIPAEYRRSDLDLRKLNLSEVPPGCIERIADGLRYCGYLE
jgi:PAS domain S-box-containing protein